MKKRKNCNDCSNCNSLGSKLLHKGLCVSRNEEVFESQRACSTDFKDVSEYGRYGYPIILKHIADDGAELTVQERGNYIELGVEEDCSYTSLEMSRESLELLANNILDFLNGKEIKYPNLELKNNDF